MLSTESFREWNDHASKLARLWLARMVSSRRVVHLDDCSCPAVLRKCTRVEATSPQMTVWGKDFHLVCAALMTDEVVVSMDETSRGLFSAIAGEVKELRRIEWINPEINPDGLQEWIGRKNRQKRVHTLV